MCWPTVPPPLAQTKLSRTSALRGLKYNAYILLDTDKRIIHMCWWLEGQVEVVDVVEVVRMVVGWRGRWW